ncbi:MAG: T9SS type A sorting domain-containing protein [Calditrichaeota bacterium]|nr:T9SS type A sorting domain-containing protein [Calditrichota bacterium]
MRKAKFSLFIALAALMLFGAAVQPVYAIWQAMLDEDFAKDQSVQGRLWPWNTPPENPGAPRWRWHPQPPHRLAEPTYTDYCWGLQDYIFNSLVRRHEAFTQSIWCASTNRNLVQTPRWPADVDYLNNQWAWVWWGPFYPSLQRAVSAAVVFWYYLDATWGCRDSLSVVVVNTNPSPNLNAIGRRGAADTTIMRTHPNIAYGMYINPNDNSEIITTFAHRTNDWQRRQFYLDNLRLLDNRGRIRDTVVNWCQRTVRVGDRDSVIAGQGIVYLCFVWHSNERVVTGKGAFIDDVMVIWDDGLFDLRPAGLYIGVPINEDSTHWLSSYTPRLNEDIRLKLNWRVEGAGQTPPFTIQCLLDSTIIYSEERRGIAGDSIFTTVADTLWTVTRGDHIIRWEIDTPIADSGNVLESNEQNNFIQYAFNVEWNPPPLFDIATPSRDSTVVHADERQSITFTINDSNETDTEFTTYLHFTTDIAGLAQDPNLIFTYHYIAHSLRTPVGESRMVWNVPRDWAEHNIADGDLVYIVGFTTDGYPGNLTIAVAPGRFLICPPRDVAPVEANPPMDYSLTRVFPNPFNKTLTVEYILPAASLVSLDVFDLSGRYVTNLAGGIQQAGKRTAVWQPENLGGGVYIVRLKAGGKIFHHKAIYTP